MLAPYLVWERMRMIANTFVMRTGLEYLAYRTRTGTDMVRSRRMTPRGAKRSGGHPGVVAIPAAVVAVALLASCSAMSAGTPARGDGSGTPLQVVAAENVWGSIARQLGGERVEVSDIVSSPDTDPHSYEPTPHDAR